VKELYSQKSYRYKVHISACFKRGDDQGVIWQRWPLDWFACELEDGVNDFQEFPEIFNFLSSAVLLSFSRLLNPTCSQMQWSLASASQGLSSLTRTFLMQPVTLAQARQRFRRHRFVFDSAQN
jgi:hypothetical protein